MFVATKKHVNQYIWYLICWLQAQIQTVQSEVRKRGWREGIGDRQGPNYNYMKKIEQCCTLDVARLLSSDLNPECSKGGGSFF